MWPFARKPKLEQGEGELSTLVLTEEEQAEIRNFFATLGKPEGAESDGSWYVHPDAYRAFTASALIGYAQDQVMLVEKANGGVVNRNTCLQKALEAARKAYSFHPLPIYLFDIGCLLEMLEEKESADNAFRKFLHLQQRFKPNEVGEITLRNRNVDAAVAQAREHLKQGT